MLGYGIIIIAGLGKVNSGINLVLPIAGTACRISPFTAECDS
jgi:hypothetical protein